MSCSEPQRLMPLDSLNQDPIIATAYHKPKAFTRMDTQSSAPTADESKSSAPSKTVYQVRAQVDDLVQERLLWITQEESEDGRESSFKGFWETHVPRSRASWFRPGPTKVGMRDRFQSYTDSECSARRMRPFLSPIHPRKSSSITSGPTLTSRRNLARPERLSACARPVLAKNVP